MRSIFFFLALSTAVRAGDISTGPSSPFLTPEDLPPFWLSHCPNSFSALQNAGLAKKLARFRDWHVERFAKLLPELAKSGEAAGLSKSQVLEVINPILKRHSPALELGELAQLLIQVFRAAKENNIDLASHQKSLGEIVSVNDVFYALRDIPDSLRHGWTLEQTAELFNLLNTTQGRLEDRVYSGMPKLLRSLIGYNADPQISFRAMQSLFKEQGIEGVVAVLPDMIEASVLKFGHSPNAILERIPAAMKGKGDFPAKLVDQSFLKLTQESRKLLPHTDSVPDFPLVPGYVRHSTLMYSVQRSFDEGLRDLHNLCLAGDESREGAFVFDPQRGLWFSLGGTTIVDFANHTARAEFNDYDLSALSANPKVLHIHPKSLEFWGRLPMDVVVDEHFREALELLPAVYPSRQDIQMFSHAIEKAAKPMKPDFVIIHSQGTTHVKLGNDLAAVNQLRQSFPDLRDAILKDPTLDTNQFNRKNTFEILQFITQRLNEKLGGHIYIQLDKTIE